MTTVTRSVRFANKGGRKRATVAATGGEIAAKAPKVAVVGQDAAGAPVGRVPRIARLMALAIKFDGLLRDGTVTSRSELARLAHVTQPRMTQIMNLLHLAPDIQEALLELKSSTSGRATLTERDLRSITLSDAWCVQRQGKVRKIAQI